MHIGFIFIRSDGLTCLCVVGSVLHFIAARIIHCRVEVLLYRHYTLSQCS